MGFRLQRRLKLPGGLGLNISKSGVSPSLRTRFGSVGSKGFSIRTGMRGLSYRGRFRKSDAGIGLLVGGVLFAVALVCAVIELLPPILLIVVWLFRVLWAVAVWIVGSLMDLIAWVFYRRTRATPDLPLGVGAARPARQAGLRPIADGVPSATIRWKLLPPDDTVGKKVSVIGVCPCGETITYDDEWAPDQHLVCARCSTDFGTLAEYKAKAAAYIQKLLRDR